MEARERARPNGGRESPAPTSRRTAEGGGRLALLLVTALWVSLAAAALVPGLDYYRTPFADRPFKADHRLFAPTGTVGHSLGIVGTGMLLVGVGAYSLRKRLPALARTGRLRNWLRFHIFLCTLGPYLVLLHTSFKFGGLVAIAFWSMALVVVSGVFGRYVYAHIPKTLNGRFRTLQEVRQERDEVLRTLRERSGDLGVEIARLVGSGGSEEALRPTEALARAARADWRRAAKHRELRRLLSGSGVPPDARAALLALAGRQAAIEQQLSVLLPFQRLFRYWHAFHLPLAGVMLLIVIVHVVVAVLFGYGWPF